MGTREQINDDMKTAMKAGEKEKLATLRLIRAEILKADKEGQGEIDDGATMAVLQRMVKQRRDSIEQFTNARREDLAATEQRELEVIESYLPQGLSDAEIDAAIDRVFAALGAPPDPSQLGPTMGRVMGELKKSGRPFDGKAVNARVRARLGG